MKLFKRGAKEEATDSGAQAIASAAIEAALKANAALWGQLEARSTEASSDWPVRVALLGFYLHVADRVVFGNAGPAMRDLLLERATAAAADHLVRVSWHITGELTAERAAWFAELVNETVHDLDVAGVNYGECRELFGHRKDIGRKEIAITRLINQILDAKPGDSVGLDQFILIGAAVPKAMLDSRLVEATTLAVESSTRKR